jgi:hypothetical protein
MRSNISVPSAVKVGGDLMEAIKGTDLREYLPENEAHGIWGAVSISIPSAMKVGISWKRLKGQIYENIHLNMMRMLLEEQYPPCLLWSWVGSKGIKGTVLRECSPEMMRMLWEEQYPPCLLWSWVGSKGFKGTVQRECSPENDAHVVGGASALSVVELGGEQGF